MTRVSCVSLVSFLPWYFFLSCWHVFPPLIVSVSYPCPEYQGLLRVGLQSGGNRLPCLHAVFTPPSTAWVASFTADGMFSLRFSPPHLYRGVTARFFVRPEGDDAPFSSRFGCLTWPARADTLKAEIIHGGAELASSHLRACHRYLAAWQQADSGYQILLW